MRILLDECVPRPLKRHLPGHEVRTVVEMGWSGKQNGELLRLILEAKFSVFLTVDQNLSYQQNLRSATIGVIVLMALTNKLRDLEPLMDRVLLTLETIQPGELVEISK